MPVPFSIGDRRQAAKRGEAAKWLSEVLAAGPVSAKEILDGARNCGISKPILYRAKEALGVHSVREGFAQGQRTLSTSCYNAKLYDLVFASTLFASS